MAHWPERKVYNVYSIINTGDTISNSYDPIPLINSDAEPHSSKSGAGGQDSVRPVAEAPKT
jgi:hypothetical protein